MLPAYARSRPLSNTAFVHEFIRRDSRNPGFAISPFGRLLC